jgi:hypothetical protein
VKSDTLAHFVLRTFYSTTMILDSFDHLVAGLDAFDPSFAHKINCFFGVLDIFASGGEKEDVVGGTAKTRKRTTRPGGWTRSL